PGGQRPVRSAGRTCQGTGQADGSAAGLSPLAPGQARAMSPSQPGEPRVTVLMSVYNGEKYLRGAIDSVLNQTFQDFEFLIVDDGSRDRSREIVAAYDDPRIRLIANEQNIGLIDSLNKGIAAARGDLIARQDADDV